MKRSSLCLILLLACAQFHFGKSIEQERPTRPEHAVLFIIDGLSSKAIGLLPLTNLQKLMSEGTYYKESYNIVPAHPKQGEWAKFHHSSIPNSVILAGTVLLRPDQRYIQQSFFPEQITAHAANDIDYSTLNVGFNLTFMHGSDESPIHDDQTLAWAAEFLQKARPAFMKIHLQDTGNAGALSYEATDPSIPWRKNIWAEGSPYRKAAIRADAYLGEFLDRLRKLGIREKTVLFVTADHGQADSGWHPADDENGWIMPLVLVGPGIRAGQRFDHAEQVDIVPTICFLMGVNPPENADGRILAEALKYPPKNVPPLQFKIKELNSLLLKGETLLKELRQNANQSPLLQRKLSEAERDFYGIERILEWHRFGSVDKLLSHNRSVLEKMSASFSQPDVTHLRLRLKIDDLTKSINGVAEISYLTSGAEIDIFSLEQRDLDIIRVETEPFALQNYQIKKESLDIQIQGAEKGKPGRFSIRYHAQPKDGLFFHRSVTEKGIPVEQVWQFNAWEYWMPKPLDPDHQMTWELEAEVRSDWQVVSNGDLVETISLGNRRIFHWRQSVPIRLEGFTFAAGRFDTFIEHTLGRRFFHYIPAGVADPATVQRSLGRIGDMCDVFSREFGYAYPFSDYKHVIIWDYHPWGTEHVGLSCLSENKLIDESARLDADDYIVAHELAHTWWAMLIAPKSPAHIWLNEAFAVYFGNQFFETAEGRDEFEFRLHQRLRLYLEEDRKYRRILVTDEPVPGGLDEHIYSKGAYILHMLRCWQGDEKFYAGLKLYLGKYAYEQADSTDFQIAMEEACGVPLDWYFQQWLHQKGYPAFLINRQWDEERGRLSLKIEQTQEETVGIYRVPAVIQIVTDAGVETHREFLIKRSEILNYQLIGRLHYVRFNADSSLLATVRFPRPADELIQQLSQATDAQGRIEALESIANIQTPEVLEALQHSLHFDLFHGVRSAAAIALSHQGDSALPILLDASRTESDPRVLKNILTALESFADKRGTVTSIENVALSNKSPYVRAGALLILARAKAAGIFEMLVRALKENAHRDVLRASAFQGFEILNDKRAVPVIIRYLSSERTTRWAREPAVEALGKLAKEDKQVRALLEHISKTDFWPGVRAAANRVLQ